MTDANEKPFLPHRKDERVVRVVVGRLAGVCGAGIPRGPTTPRCPDAHARCGYTVHSIQYVVDMRWIQNEKCQEWDSDPRPEIISRPVMEFAHADKW